VEGQARNRLPVSQLLCLIFFVSGMSALIFENLWFRLAGLTFGNSIWSSALVLSSFMCGLALGNGLAVFRCGSTIRNPIRSYSYLEMVIAVTGMSLVLGFPALTQWLAPLFRYFSDSPSTINIFRLGISFMLMMIPATAMGMTLPLLVKALYDDSPSFGRVLGRLYGWNTLGALVGALLPDALLIGAFGITGAGLAAGGMNLLAAGAALCLSLKYERVKTEIAARPVLPLRISMPSRTATRLLAASFLSGGILLGLEVVWFRFLILFFNPFSIVFAVMLAVVLAGIGLGGMVGSWWFRVQPLAYRYVVPLAFLAGATSIAAYALFGHVTGLLHGGADRWSYALCLSLPLMFPTSLISGILFTLIGAAVHEDIGGSVETTGLLTMVNTTGATLGAALAGFLLLPNIGMEKSLFGLSISYASVALLSVRRSHFPSIGRNGYSSVAAAIVFAFLVLWFPFGSMRQHILSVGRKAVPGTADWSCMAIRENLTETSQYWQMRLLGKPIYKRLFTNNHPMSSTNLGARRYMDLFAYWPVAMHPCPRDALLICFGVGNTAKALTDTRTLQSIDVVDISKNILEDSALIFPDTSENPLHDPRVTMHVEDGRFFLQTTDRRFDIITGEPPPPLAAGVVNLYSQEYFQLIHDRLRDGGMVTYWLPVQQMSWSAMKSIIRGFCNVFDDCSLWNSINFEWMLVGIRNPGPRVSDDHFSAQWKDPRVRSELAAVGFEVPEQIGATFIMDARALREWTRDSLPVVDNYPLRILGKSEDSYMYARRDWEGVMNSRKSAAAFQASAFIGKLWPESLRASTLDYFPVQQLINNAYIDPLPPGALPDIEALHKVLTESSLRFPVFLISGGPDLPDASQILDTLDEEARQKTPGIPFQFGVRALADRDYLLAAKYFEGERDEHLLPRVLLYRVYSLCMAGELQKAQELLREKGQILASRSGKEHVKWLRETFGISPDPQP
jgi:spermidine synthase